MFRTILIPQTGQNTDKQSLDAAYAFLREDGGHMECLYIHDDAAAIASCMQTDAMGVPVVTPELLTALNENAKAQKSEAKRDFDAFCAKHGVIRPSPQSDGGAVSASWHTATADITATISAESRYHDATILTRRSDPTGLSVTNLGTIAIAGGRPVILMPGGWRPQSLDHVAIAWKETPEAAHAVMAALPVLRKAKSVAVLSATEDDNSHAAGKAAHACVGYLKRHGIEAENIPVEDAGVSARSSLFSEAARQSADLVVMGAYGHSRLRELVLGGFTREVLADSKMPVFLMH